MTAVDHPVNPEDLMAYLDGELPGAQAAVVQAHVAGCEECLRSSGDLRGVSRDLASWQVEETPATLTAPLPSPGTTTRARWHLGWLLKPAGAFALGALSVVMVIFGVIYGPTNQRAARINTFSELDQEFYEYGRPAVRPRIEVDAKSRPYGGSAPPQAAASAPPVLSAQTPGAPGPAIARTARLVLTAKDFEAARRTVERVVADMGGWFRQVDVSGASGEARRLIASLMIPADRLDDAMAALKAVGLVSEESKKAEDVTDQVVDVDARLSNARNTEKRLVDLLQNRTGKLDDVLAAEREIARVREEIERFDAQRKDLTRRVRYATLLLEVGEEQHPRIDVGPQPLWSMVRDALTTGVTQALNSALGVALFAARVLPTLLLWVAVLGWPVLMLVRWSRRRINAAP